MFEGVRPEFTHHPKVWSTNKMSAKAGVTHPPIIAPEQSCS